LRFEKSVTTTITVNARAMEAIVSKLYSSFHINLFVVVLDNFVISVSTSAWPQLLVNALVTLL